MCCAHAAKPCPSTVPHRAASSGPQRSPLAAAALGRLSGAAASAAARRAAAPTRARCGSRGPAPSAGAGAAPPLLAARSGCSASRSSLRGGGSHGYHAVRPPALRSGPLYVHAAAAGSLPRPAGSRPVPQQRSTRPKGGLHPPETGLDLESILARAGVHRDGYGGAEQGLRACRFRRTGMPPAPARAVSRAAAGRRARAPST